MFRREFLLPLTLAAALFAGACESLPEATGPEPAPMVPELENTAPLLGLRATSFENITLIKQPPLDGLLRQLKLIGPEGGLIELAGHSILVPPGAIDRPAFFSLVALPTGYVEVELLAFTRALLGIIDVGSRGFDKPVDLTLSYARATNVRDPDKLFILRLNLFRPHERMPSTVDKGSRTVTAQLDHFSRYCMASN